MTIINKLSSQLGDRSEEGNRRDARECLKDPGPLLGDVFSKK